MPVFYCPLCPLIFEHRTEVEWHLRNEHRSHDREEALLRAELTDASADLDWTRLRALRAVAEHPSVTVLMATTPAPAMTGVDIARLRRLADHARRRLRAEPATAPIASVEHRLWRAIAASEGHATHRGLALLVSQHHLVMFGLPFEPRDRVVVDPTFATRDLEEMLARYPRYRVVVLGREPRILEGRGGQLTKIPLPALPGGPSVVPGRHERNAERPERWMTRRARVDAGCRRADELLDRRVEAAGPSPLVVMGDNRWLAGFAEHSRHWPSVVGQVTGCRPRSTPAEVAKLAEPAIAAWRAAQQRDVLEELRAEDGHGRVAWGLGAAWDAVNSGRAERLWIERGATTPGRIVRDGQGIEPAPDPARPGVIDDLEDDLIERASTNGVPVSIVDDGSLTGTAPAAARQYQPDPVAVRLRSPWDRPDLRALAQAGPSP